MILIADSGSTQTQWCLINSDNHLIRFSSEGFNPFYVDTSYIIDSLGRYLPEEINKGKVTGIFFYGAGCIPGKAWIIKKAISQLFSSAKIEVETDLLASARALLGNKAGFAAILGTGMNSCFYDGKKITHQINPLGYFLGDEGSGNYMGKKLLVDFIRDQMPSDLRNKFIHEYQLTSSEIMDRIYNQPYPNRFCADFTKFLYKNIQHTYSINIVKDSFRDFFRRIVFNYPGIKKYSFNCVGSIGYYFKNILSEVVKENSMEIGTIIQCPVNGLAEYHLNLLSI